MAFSKISTKDMPHEEWLAYRNKSVGGSDAAPILGLSKYKSAYSLWAEKTGRLIPEDISDKEAVRLGNDLEQYVADRFAEATGKKVRNDNYIRYNSDYPFAHANVDRLVIGENAGLECKTTSSYEVLKQCREGEFPSTWYCQMTHYMAITGAEKWYLGVLVFGQGFFWFEIKRKQAEIDALMKAEEEFWECVKNDTPPEMDGSSSTAEAVKMLYKESENRSVDLTGVGHYLEMYSSLGEQIKALETQQNECAVNIQNFMQSAEKGIYGAYTVSWKTQSRKTFDKKAFEKDHGTISDNYYKTSESRPFKVTVK